MPCVPGSEHCSSAVIGNSHASAEYPAGPRQNQCPNGARLLPLLVGNLGLPAGISLYVLAPGLWLVGLRQVELSIAYPFIALAATGVIVVAPP